MPIMEQFALPRAMAASAASAAPDALIIDGDLRTITIPATVKSLGVASDANVTRLHFSMPRHYGDVDLSEFVARINYRNANKEGDVYAVTDMAATTDTITFSWLVGRNAVAYKGSVQFIVCLKKADTDQEYNTTVASLPVLEGLETTEAIVQEHPDIIEDILRRLDELPQGGNTGGNTGGNGSNSGQNANGGLNDTAKNLLITILRSGVYSTDQSANITALEAALSVSGGIEDPDKPEAPESGVTQVGAVLSIVSGVTVTQNDSTLNIA